MGGISPQVVDNFSSARSPIAARAATGCNPGTWQMLRGRVAKIMGAARTDNPNAKDSAAWRCWDFGYTAPRGEPASQGGPAKAGRVRAGTVKVGRGRSILGGRGEWSEAYLDVLRLCIGGSAEQRLVDVAAIVGRSEQAVRTQRARLRKADGARP